MSDPERKVFVCAVFRNEAPYILEWIAYHRVIKVDHFYIYNDKSTDGTAEILQRLDQAGIITYRDRWPREPDGNRQLAAYKNALGRLRNKCDWLAFIDADEFIVPRKHGDLKTFLADYKDVAGIAINWKIFGSAGHLRKTEGLVMERFTRCGPDDLGIHRHVKTMVRPQETQDILNCHCARFRGHRSKYVYPEKGLVPLGFEGLGNHIDHGSIQINHYFTKSKEEWELKRARGRPADSAGGRTERDFHSHDRNENEDLWILRFSERTKREMESLRQAVESGRVFERPEASPSLFTKAVKRTSKLWNKLICSTTGR